MIRGIKTLDVRMERISGNAQRLAEFLHAHPAVHRVFYPGLPDHPDHALARTQMQRGYGGMIAFELHGGLEAGRQLVERVCTIRHAVSLGGVESLISHPASTTHAMVDPAQRLAGGWPFRQQPNMKK